MARIRKQLLRGSNYTVFINGVRALEARGAEVGVTVDREDVNVADGGDDSVSVKIGQTGEWSMDIHKVYSRAADYLDTLQANEDPELQLVFQLESKDAGVIERFVIDSAVISDLPIITFEAGAIIEETMSGNFTVGDGKYTDRISYPTTV